MRTRWRAASALVLVPVMVAAAACGSGSGSGSKSGSGSGPHGLITVTTGSTSPFVANFNPFSPTVQPGANGMIYEPLMFFNTARAGDVQPWLAQSYSWNSDGTAITFKLRSGVTWNDGKPFSAADVAYTFNLDVQEPALNTKGLPIKNAVANADGSVTVSFTKPAYQQLVYIAGKTLILPQHIWSGVSDKKTFADAKPVGTGAWTVGKVNSQVMELTANPHYYMPDMPKAKTIRFLTFTGNSTADQAIESGEIDWGGGFVPDIKKNFLSKNAKYAVEDIPLSVTYLVPNYKQGPTADKAVRQAISQALDREFISQSVYNGYAPPTNPMDLLTPNFNSILDPSLADQKFGKADPAGAKQTLQSAGYALGSNGMFNDKSGKPLEITVKQVTGWSDYTSVLQIAEQELAAAGIKLNVQAEAYASFIQDQNNGDFQLLIDNFGYTSDPYQYYNQLLNGSVAPPIGQVDQFGDYGRFDDPQVDSLLADVSATQDANKQKQDYYRIEHLVLQDVPTIPLFAAQDEIEFNGNHVKDYPTTDNPYAAPPIWLQPDEGWVALHIAPAS
ncbi:ABC transporter substrate-binding protein [Actinocrinis puniceicyclus]|uniref:ABC transporter substrate-binding protein n=1 Tax=Actinocrinis puniceicyclus TaxID=977794 RepID=A0A8J7WII0_9ACTN|nr:ABC transporter substrate-binding protein [Actinocrinis puniceicyclus]MBS2961938.1 ABC transporter substrate-binding protein [Actinocrinis puniceicyclus]